MGLQIARRAVRLPTDDEIAAWRGAYDTHHGVTVRGLVSPDLLTWIRRRLDTARFTEYLHVALDPPAIDLLMDDPELDLTLWSIFNDARLFDAVRRITGCDPIGRYHCRVYAMDPSPAHRDAWHDDVDGNRLVAMSVNLGGAYDGGVLRIREGERLVHEVANTGDGDAILFRIREGLQHIVAPVVGTRRKTALAGWFERAPRALDVLRRRVAAGAADGKW